MASIDFAKGLIGTTLAQFQPQQNKGSGKITVVRGKVPLGKINVAQNGNTLCMKTLGNEWRFQSANRSPIGILSANCIHSSYTGDLNTCCLTGASGDPKKTCDPSFTNSRETHTACSDAWLAKCAGSEVATNTDCQNWAKKNPDNGATISLLSNYCAANPNDSFCRSLRTIVPKAFDSYMDIYCVGDKLDESICVDWAKTKFGLIDSRMMEYCSKKDAKGLCACINSEVSNLTKMFGSRAQVQCIDADCNLSGYKTAGMLSACPDVVDCSVINFLKDNSGSINLSKQVINQNCSLTKTTNGDTSTVVNPNSTTTTVSDNGLTKMVVPPQTINTPLPPASLPQTGNVSVQQASSSDVSDSSTTTLNVNETQQTSTPKIDEKAMSPLLIFIIIFVVAILIGVIGFGIYKFVQIGKTKP